MPEVEEVVLPAEESSATDSPTETDDSTAKDGEKESGETLPAKGKSSQETPSPDDSEEDSKEPDKGKPVPYAQWKDMRDRHHKLRDKLQEFEGLGIKTKEHAEFLRHESEKGETLDYVLDQMENKPDEFFADFAKRFPKQYDAHFGKARPQETATFLTQYADAYRRRGEDGDSEIAKVLDSLSGKALDGGKREAEPDKPKDADRESQLLDREYGFFARQVSSGIESEIMEKINELTKGTEFASAKQKSKFVQQVFTDLNEEMNQDELFVRERSAAQSAKRGLSKNQVKDVVSLYVRNATAEDRLNRVVRENLADRGLGRATVRTNGKIPERREVTGDGVAASGKVGQDARQEILREVHNAGFTGADIMIEFGRRLDKLRGL